MANSLFDKIMGKVPVPAKVPAEDKIKWKEKNGSEPEIRKEEKTTIEPEEETESEPKIRREEKAAIEPEEKTESEPEIRKEEKAAIEPEEETGSEPKIKREEKAAIRPEGETESELIFNDTGLKKLPEPVEVVNEDKKNEQHNPSNDIQMILNKMFKNSDPGGTRQYVKPETKVQEKKAEEYTETTESMENMVSVSPSQVILIDLILDNTISMKIYYKILYDKLFNLVNGIHKMAKKSGGNVEIRYGITYIRDTEPIIEDSFSSSSFTKDVLQIMEKLKSITFSGGAKNGRENINGAIRASLLKLSHAADESTKCGILLFTDSLPEEEEMVPDFTGCGDVRFVHCFVNDDRDYIPVFQVVDHDGKNDSRLINDVKVRTLESFLNGNTDSITLELISEILEQVSVNGK